MPTAPADRNYSQELTGILGGLDSTTASYVRQQLSANPALTQNNLANFTTALRGNFDATAYDKANPGFLQSYRDQQAAGQLAGWTPEQFAAANSGVSLGDPSLNSYYGGGIGQLLRESYDQANPQLAAYGGRLQSTLDQLNAQPAPRYDPSGYMASGSGNQTAAPTALASFSPQQAQAYTARQSYATGGPLLGGLEADAMRGLGQVSPLQMQQQRLAQSLLSAGGNLTAGENADVQQSARAAYADRGLLRSNRGIGAEILAGDAARRNRLVQNLGLAQGIDTAGQQQLATGRNYALGVQGQGQGLSTFNAGQGNALGQFNAGQLAGTSQFNAGQTNAIGANLANSNADRLNQSNQFYAGLGQANNQFNANATNQAAAFNATASNAANLYNAQSAGDAANNTWNRAMGLGQFYGSQAINPGAIAGSVVGAAPDYTGALLNYGQDVNNTNYNAANARYIGAGNNSAAKTGSILGSLGTLGGALIGGGTGAGSVLGSLGGLLGICWVARAVYGEHDPRWREFRGWLITRAQPATLAAYMARGPRLARRVHRDAVLRTRLRAAMDTLRATLTPPALNAQLSALN